VFTACVIHHGRCCLLATRRQHLWSCEHSLVLLRMGKNIARNMLSWLKLLIKLLLSHLVGCLYYYNITDVNSLSISARWWYIKTFGKWEWCDEKDQQWEQMACSVLCVFPSILAFASTKKHDCKWQRYLHKQHVTYVFIVNKNPAKTEVMYSCFTSKYYSSFPSCTSSPPPFYSFPHCDLFQIISSLLFYRIYIL